MTEKYDSIDKIRPDYQKIEYFDIINIGKMKTSNA